MQLITGTPVVRWFCYYDLRDFNKVDNNFYNKHKELIEDTLEGDALVNQVHMALNNGTDLTGFKIPLALNR